MPLELRPIARPNAPRASTGSPRQQTLWRSPGRCRGLTRGSVRPCLPASDPLGLCLLLMFSNPRRHLVVAVGDIILGDVVGGRVPEALAGGKLRAFLGGNF